MKKRISRNVLSPGKEEVSPSPERALTSLARRDLFSGAVGATAVAVAASLAPANAAPAAAKGAAMTLATQSASQASDRTAALGVVRGTLAFSTRENGTC